MLDAFTDTHKLLIAILGILLFGYVTRRTLRHSRLRLPGPPAHWLTGNLSDIPRNGHEWIAYNDLTCRYGSDVVHLNALGSNILVINSYDAARDLLDKKGALYSDRPRLVMIKELMGWSWNLVLMSYGASFTAHRKVVQQEFQANIVTQRYRDTMSLEVFALMRHILDKPQDTPKHFKLMAGAIIMMVTYGHKVTSVDDQFVMLAEAVREGGEKHPGTRLVDIFPLLKHVPSWFPGAVFKQEAAARRKLAFQMRSAPYEMVKRAMEKGSAIPCMTTRLLQQELPVADVDADELVMNCTGVVYSAGADTTAAALTNFLLAMTLNPDVQARAHEELDAVVGRDRLPSFEDRERLPFVSNVVKEAFRWRAVSPLGVAHYTLDEDEYRGAYIAKGTTVVANLHAMLHDPSVYKDPEAFNPDRYLSTTENPSGEPDPSRAVFGFGRRICPGRFFAQDSVWLAAATFLHCITASDPTGELNIDNLTWSSGLVSFPSPFPFKLEPRFGRVSELVTLFDSQ